MKNLQFLVENYQTPPEAITLVENSRILLLAGISGAGKDTTKKHLLKNPEYRDIVSHTTRPPRTNKRQTTKRPLPHDRSALLADAERT